MTEKVVDVVGFFIALTANAGEFVAASKGSNPGSASAPLRIGELAQPGDVATVTEGDCSECFKSDANPFDS